MLGGKKEMFCEKCGKEVQEEWAVADYQHLEIEGYMDTIDLTGSYNGRWG